MIKLDIAGHSWTDIREDELEGFLDDFLNSSKEDFNSVIVYTRSRQLIINFLYIYFNVKSQKLGKFVSIVKKLNREGKCHLESIPFHLDGSFMCNMVDAMLNISKYGENITSIEHLYGFTELDQLGELDIEDV